MVELIISDLMTVRDRGTYMGLMFAISSTVSGAGPVISGALVDAGKWRWIWYMNLPIGGACLVVSFIWLRLGQPLGNKSFVQRISSIDWIGAILIVASIVGILWSIAYGGATKPWYDPGVIAGLVAGHIGLVLFIIWQGMPQCRNPIAPLRLFSNSTSSIGFILAFFSCIIIYWPVFMLPLYFQAVLGTSPKRSGIEFLPFIFFFPVGAMVGGGLMAKTGRYKHFHAIGFGLCMLSFGLCAILDHNSHQALWVVFEILIALGLGIPIACILPPIQAALSDKDTATSTAVFAFIRSLGSIWGLAIPAAIFNNRFSQLLETINDESARNKLANGQAYALASADFSSQFTGPVREQVIAVYTESLKRTWQIAVIFAGIPFVLCLLEKEIPLRQEIETDFGIEKKEKIDEKNGEAAAMKGSGSKK